MSIFLSFGQFHPHLWTIERAPAQRKEATERGNRSHNAKDVAYYFALHPFGRRHKKAKQRLLVIGLFSHLLLSGCSQTNKDQTWLGSRHVSNKFHSHCREPFSGLSFFSFAQHSFPPTTENRVRSFFYESSLSVDGRDKFMNEIGKHQRAIAVLSLCFYQWNCFSSRNACSLDDGDRTI